MEPTEVLLSATGFGIIFGLAIALIILVFLAFYVYTSLAWMTIAKKLKYKKAWLAWIPIANVAMMLQLGGFHWAWIFLIIPLLILIPLIVFIPFTLISGLILWIFLFSFLLILISLITLTVLVFISTWRIFEKRKYPGWFVLLTLIPWIGGILYLVFIGLAAWSDNHKK